MEILIVSTIAFLSAGLTFFSGFGLGTILLPVFILFFPVDIAIALVGVVHFTNNLFKITLVSRYIDRTVLIRFGLPAIGASFAGAWLLLRIADLPIVSEYYIGASLFQISPAKLIVGILLICFSFMDLFPSLIKLQFKKDHFILGGILSGFFGGLTGIQGALRSAFLVRAGLSKEAYIASGVIIASLVDVSRLSVYAGRFQSSNLTESLSLVICTTAAAIIGAYLGSRILKKVTMKFIKALVGTLMILISLALILGLI